MGANMMIGLLVPYLFLNLPAVLFNFLRGKVGRWIAFIAVVLRLFIPGHFPELLELHRSLILLLVVTPHLIVEMRGGYVGITISLIISGCLLARHIRIAGGFRNALAERCGWINTLGIVLLFVNPVLESVKII